MLRINKHTYQIRVFGNDFILLENHSSHTDNLRIGESILQADYEWIDEVIATEEEICIKLANGFNQSHLDQLEHLEIFPSDEGPTYKLPIYFGEELDWAAVKIYTGLSKAEFITKLVDSEFNIAMFGFLPGFIYFNGLSKELHVPRKNTPSVEVLENALAIGDKYLGFYSLPSPGGWHIIGQCPFQLFDREALPPVVIPRTSTIQIVEIDQRSYTALKTKGINFKIYNDSN